MIEGEEHLLNLFSGVSCSESSGCQLQKLSEVQAIRMLSIERVHDVVY